MDIFIRHPVLALLPAVLFVAAYVQLRVRSGRGFLFSRFVVLAAGCFWLLYSLYEFGVQRELKPDGVPIRVDLAVVYPALILITAAGFTAYVFAFRRRIGQSL